MQFDQLNRREFITLLGGAAAAWPVAARAQQAAMPVVGYLSARSPEDTTHLVEAFRRGLKETGFIDGQNVTVEYRWALGQYDRLPAMAAEFARRPVAVTVATGGEPAALAAKAATSTVPICFFDWWRPHQAGPCGELQQPWRQFDWEPAFDQPAGAQAALLVAPASAAGDDDRLSPKSESTTSRTRAHVSGSRPAQASLTLRPAGSLSRPRRPLSRGSNPRGYPHEPLVSYRINRQLSVWNLPPLVMRAFGALCQKRTFDSSAFETYRIAGRCSSVRRDGLRVCHCWIDPQERHPIIGFSTKTR